MNENQHVLRQGQEKGANTLFFLTTSNLQTKSIFNHRTLLSFSELLSNQNSEEQRDDWLKSEVFELRSFSCTVLKTSSHKDEEPF